MNIAEHLEIVRQTDPGLLRSNNEDSVGGEHERGFVVLADGMGGHNAGEIASSIAVSVLCEEIREQLKTQQPGDLDQATGNAAQLLEEGISKANRAIIEEAQRKPQFAGMGTTLVAALFYQNRVVVAHAGDSRLYRLRDNEFIALTKDHSILQQHIDRGGLTKEEARQSKYKNLITRSLGMQAEIEPGIQILETRVDDLYLLCSDGLSDMLEDEAIAEIINGNRNNLTQAAANLIQQANQNGGKDNISVILVRVKGRIAAPFSFWQEIKRMTGFLQRSPGL